MKITRADKVVYCAECGERTFNAIKFGLPGCEGVELGLCSVCQRQVGAALVQGTV